MEIRINFMKNSIKLEAFGSPTMNKKEGELNYNSFNHPISKTNKLNETSYYKAS